MKKIVHLDKTIIRRHLGLKARTVMKILKEIFSFQIQDRITTRGYSEALINVNLRIYFTCSVVERSPGTSELLRVTCSIGAIETLRTDVGSVEDDRSKCGIAVEPF